MIYIYIISTLFFLINIYSSRESTFDGVGSDAVKQVNAAANFRNWGYFPSGMHKYAGAKAWMKDAGVLFLIPFQFLLKDYKSFYPVVVASNFAHFISSILLYSLIHNFFGVHAAIIVYILYYFSFWPKMISLHGGLQVLAELFLLTSILFLQFSVSTNPNIFNYIYAIISGFSFILMNFSSASSRKYIPIFIIIIFKYLFEFSFSINYFNILFLALLILYYFNINNFYNKLISFSFFKYKHHILLKFILYSFFYIIFISLFIRLFFIISNENFITLIFVLFGFLFGALFFLLPNFKTNISGYLYYWFIENKHNSHYSLYNKYFKDKYGKVFNKGEEGPVWYLKFYFMFMPFILFMYISSFLFLTIYLGCNLNILFIYAIPIFPILWNEFTLGPKALLPMYTTFIAFFIPISYFISLAEKSNYSSLIFIIIYSITIISIIWNIWIYIFDIFPCRMTVKKLVKKLDEFGIKEFFTYDTLFNYPFIPVLETYFPNKYNIKYIKSIAEIQDGYVFIPCTGSKAAYYQSCGTIGPVGDFKDDIKLTNLFLDKIVNNIAITKFKTLGTSKYWQQLGNVVSFRDLILSELNKEDYDKGYAWILRIKK